MKVRKYIQIWALLLFIWPLTFCQNNGEVMSKSIDIGSGSGYGYSIIEGFEGNYFLASFTNCPFTPIECIGLVEIDTDLNVLQKVIYRNTATNNSYSGRDGMETIGDSIFALASTFFKLREDSSYTYVPMVTFMDENFNVLDTFHYYQDIPGLSYIRSIQSVGDSSLLISGAKNAVSGSNLYSHGWLMKIDLSGEKLWNKEFYRGESKSISIESLDVLGNEDILIGIWVGVEAWEYNGKAVLMDSEGDIKQEYIFPDTSRVGRFIATSINDSIFVANWMYVREFDHVHLTETPWIHGFHRNGEILWSHHFDLLRGTDALVNSIRSTSDNGIIGVGHSDWTRIIPEEKKLPSDPGDAGWAFKLSLEGELEWEKFYYDPRHLDGIRIPAGNYLIDVIETPEGEFIMVGSKEDTIGRGSLNLNIWVLKTDAEGCLIGHYHCDTLQIVGDSTKRMLDIYTDVVYEWQEEELSIYPNPSSDHLNIEFPQMSGGVLRLVNMKGEMMMEKAFQNRRQVEFQLGSYPAGMYILEYFDVGQRKYSRSKVVIH